MPFDYYARLTRQQKATYRRSDAVAGIELPSAASFAPLLERIRIALADDHRVRLERATAALAAALVEALGAGPVTVRVLARRPADEHAELHGLYVREDDGAAVIRLWMRTAAFARPVAFRTFVRTLLHELCHHFDFELLELEDTFHTDGFFRRESSLVRQLLGEAPRRAARRTGQAKEPPQLELFRKRSR